MNDSIDYIFSELMVPVTRSIVGDFVAAGCVAGSKVLLQNETTVAAFVSSMRSVLLCRIARWGLISAFSLNQPTTRNRLTSVDFTDI